MTIDKKIVELMRNVSWGEAMIYARDNNLRLPDNSELMKLNETEYMKFGALPLWSSIRRGSKIVKIGSGTTSVLGEDLHLNRSWCFNGEVYEMPSDTKLNAILIPIE